MIPQYETAQMKKRRLMSSKGSQGGRKVSSTYIQRPLPVNRFQQILGGGKPNINEIKYADVAFSDDNFQVIGSFTPILLNGLAQGAGQTQRIGNKIAMKSLRVRGQILQLATAVATYARIIIYYDKQTNGNPCAAGDLLLTTTTAPVAATSVFSELNLQNVERFLILRDYVVSLPSASYAAGVQTNVGFDPGQNPNGGSILDVDMFIKLKGLQTLYKGASAVVGDIATGGLFMVCLNYAGVAAWTFRNTERLRYYDN